MRHLGESGDDRLWMLLLWCELNGNQSRTWKHFIFSFQHSALLLLCFTFLGWMDVKFGSVGVSNWLWPLGSRFRMRLAHTAARAPVTSLAVWAAFWFHQHSFYPIKEDRTLNRRWLQVQGEISGVLWAFSEHTVNSTSSFPDWDFADTLKGWSALMTSRSEMSVLALM